MKFEKGVTVNLSYGEIKKKILIITLLTPFIWSSEFTFNSETRVPHVGANARL